VGVWLCLCLCVCMVQHACERLSVLHIRAFACCPLTNRERETRDTPNMPLLYTAVICRLKLRAALILPSFVTPLCTYKQRVRARTASQLPDFVMCRARYHLLAAGRILAARTFSFLSILRAEIWVRRCMSGPLGASLILFSSRLCV